MCPPCLRNRGQDGAAWLGRGVACVDPPPSIIAGRRDRAWHSLKVTMCITCVYHMMSLGVARSSGLEASLPWPSSYSWRSGE